VWHFHLQFLRPYLMLQLAAVAPAAAQQRRRPPELQFPFRSWIFA
jgi:hypothetical protein